MSSAAYANVFKSLGGPFQTRNPGSGGASGSGPHAEGADESVAPEVRVDPLVDVETRDENVHIQIDVEDDQERANKKRKSAAVKAPKVMDPAIETVICDEDGKGPDGEVIRVGNLTLQKLADIMIDIPTDEEISEREASGLAAVQKKIVGHWGYLGGLIASASDIAAEEVKKQKELKRSAMGKVSKLEIQISGLKKSHGEEKSRLEAEVKTAKDRAEASEKESGSLKARIEELEKQISEQKPESLIIEEFKKSDEYDLALATAGVAEVQRCWLIAEKHIKTDPLANWNSFTHEFVAAKRAIEDGKGEPEPYDGPSPSFIPAPLNQIDPDLQS